MYLMQDRNWKGVHFSDGRCILKVDHNLYPQAMWEQLVNKTGVEPMDGHPGHYKVKEK